jgi:thiamine kinase-like enzyme
MIQKGYVSTILDTKHDTSNVSYKVLAKLENDESIIAYAKRLDEDIIAREIIASLIGQNLNINIPEPCILTLNNKLIDPNSDGEIKCFGSSAKNNSGFERFINDDKGFEKFICDYDRSFDVSVFDEWLFNTDRNFRNIIIDGSTIWFIDHEKIIPNDINVELLSRANALFDIIQRKYTNAQISDKVEYYRNSMYPKMINLQIDTYIQTCLENGLISEEISQFLEDAMKNRLPFLSLIIEKRFCTELRGLFYD